MLKFLWRIWNVIVRTEETQSVLLWLFPPLSGIVAVVSACISNLPIYQIMFWGLGVAFFTIGILTNIIILHRQNTVRNKLSINSIALGEGPFVRENNIGLRFTFKIKSHANRDIYFRIKRINLVIEGRTPTKYQIPEMVSILQARAEETVGGPFIDDIEKKPLLDGNLEMEIMYGPASDNLCFKWFYNGDIGILFGPLKNGEGRVYVQLAHNSIEHTRIAA